MSGNKRRESLSQNNPFGSTEETKAVTFEQTDSELFGKIAERDDAKLVAPSVTITEIYPNPTQPRRALPSIIRAHWNGDPKTLGDAFAFWENEVNAERQANGYNEHFDVAQLLNTNVDESQEKDATRGPLEETFLEIIRLANSIHRDGLLNPITAAYMRVERIYLLETGERRWLAYHLLSSVFPQEKQWKRIPTRTVDQVNVWRQASENAARQDLNAIGKARQFAVLMMDLVSKEKGTEFQPFNAFNHEREFYAQVESLALPYGKAEFLQQALNVSSRQSFSRYRTLLRLDDSVWTLGDDYNASERFLEELADVPVEKALKLIESSRARDDSQITKTPQKVLKKPPSGLKQSFSFLMRADKGKVIDDKVGDVMDNIDTIRQWLDEIETKWQRKKG